MRFEETGMCANVSHIHHLQGLSGTAVVVSALQRVHTRGSHQRASSMNRLGVAPKLSDFSQGDVNIQTAFESV